jgi:hypothetical protein
MRNFLFSAALTLVLAAPASSQIVTFAGQQFVRTFYGCAPGISCHLVTVSWGMGQGGITQGLVRAQSFFSHNAWGAGYPLRLIVSSFPRPAWAFSDEYYSFGTQMQPYYDETFPLDPSADGSLPNPWRPHWLEMSVSYGSAAGEPGLGPYGARVPLSVTPEPASMILLGTGIGALALARRRRRRAQVSAPRP